MKRSIVLFVCLFSAWFAPVLASQEQVTRDLYIILVDTSSSMNEVPRGSTEKKIDTVRRVLRVFVKSIPDNSQTLFASFDRGINKPVYQRLVQGEADRTYLARLVATKTEPKGGATHVWFSLRDMVIAGSRWLHKYPDSEVRLFLYTDGEDNSNAKDKAGELLAPYSNILKSKTVRAQYYTLGFSLEAAHRRVLEQLNIEVLSSKNPQVDLVPPPLPKFDSFPNRPMVASEVVFRDLSKGHIRSWLWDFGDGTTSNDRAATHHYTRPGRYLVRLTITTEQGRSSSARAHVVVSEKTPAVAAFIVNKHDASTGEELSFWERCQGKVTELLWDFGDGSTALGPTSRHTFKEAGRYKVVLRAKDEDGNEIVSKPIEIEVFPPAAPKPQISGPRVVSPGRKAEFQALISGEWTNYQWDFGDGQGLDSGDPQQRLDRLTPSHLFKTKGIHTITFICTGPGGEARATHELEVIFPPAPTVRIQGPEGAVETNESVQFFAFLNGDWESFAWDFGGGTKLGGKLGEPGIEKLMTPTHSWSKPGKYKVRLTAMGLGGSKVTELEVTVELPAEPVAAFTIGVNAPRAEQIVRFTDESTGIIQRRIWSFGDETEPVEAKDAGLIEHAYAKPGHYTISLTVSGPGGDNVVSHDLKVRAIGASPVAGFEILPFEGPGPLEVRFANKSEGAIADFAWDFGDGSRPLAIASISEVAHRFDPGEYTVTLKARSKGFADAVVKHRLTIPFPPTWFAKNFWYLLLGSIILLGSTVLGLRAASRARAARMRSYLAGVLTVSIDRAARIACARIRKQDHTTELQVPAATWAKPSTDRAVSSLTLRRAADRFELILHYGSDDSRGSTKRVDLRPERRSPGEYSGTHGAYQFRFRAEG